MSRTYRPSLAMLNGGTIFGNINVGHTQPTGQAETLINAEAKTENCPTCEGSGRTKKNTFALCMNCAGSGQVPLAMTNSNPHPTGCPNERKSSYAGSPYSATDNPSNRNYVNHEVDDHQFGKGYEHSDKPV